MLGRSLIEFKNSEKKLNYNNRMILPSLYMSKDKVLKWLLRKKSHLLEKRWKNQFSAWAIGKNNSNKLLSPSLRSKVRLWLLELLTTLLDLRLLQSDRNMLSNLARLRLWLGIIIINNCNLFKKMVRLYFNWTEKRLF